MLDFFTWWISLEAAGLIALPLAFRLFSGLPDRGYAFAKPLGLLLTGYLFWLVGLTGFLSNSRMTIGLVVIAIGVVSLYLLRHHWPDLGKFLWRERWTVLAVEVLFFGAFALWALVRSYDSAILHTEQPMDFAFLNASILSQNFPPNDPWLSGNSISYYYFGYLISGALAKLTGVAGSVAYNLALALVFALTATAAFGLVYNLVRMHRGDGRMGQATPIALGLLGSLFVVGIGNLQGFVESIRTLGLGTDGLWDWFGVPGFSGVPSDASLYPDQYWWWFRSTRVIEATAGDGVRAITEFPSFSFILGDLHPHVMSLPFVLLVLGLGLQSLTSKEIVDWQWAVKHPLRVLIVAVALGALAFLNSWDLPTGAAVILGLTLLNNYRLWDGLSWERLRDWAIFAMALGILVLLLYLPFYLGTRPQPLFPWVLPVEDVNTRYIHYLLVLGLLLFFCISFLVVRTWPIWKRAGFSWPLAGASVGTTLLPFTAWIVSVLLLGAVQGDIADSLTDVGWRFVMLLPLHAVIAVALFSLLRSARPLGRSGPPSSTSLLFVLALVLTGFSLTLGPELFRIADLFGTRMNTVFKFYYQAWIVLAIASAFAVYYVSTKWRRDATWRRMGLLGWSGVAAVLVVGSGLYVYGAIENKTGGFSSDRSLDGLAFVERRSSAEAEAMRFLVSEGAPDSVIVEAVGITRDGSPSGDYHRGFNEEGEPLNLEYGRVSGRTGLPTLLGWAGHEHQWRGSRHGFNERMNDVTEIYTGSDASLTRELLDKYGVTYVYVGSIERARYDSLDIEKLDRIMDRVFDEGGITIFGYDDQ